MTVSAYFHTLHDPWNSRLAEIALASTIALAPSQIFTWLFARSGPRGNFEEWEYQVGALRKYWYLFFDKKFEGPKKDQRLYVY